MTAITTENRAEERIEALERRLFRLEAQVLPARREMPSLSVPPPERMKDAPAVRSTAPAPPAPPRIAVADLIGGRGLAWLGGLATLLGIVLLLALAISHGWIGREARVVLAAAASGFLLTGGIWLHARRGRTEAAVTMVGVGTAGLFATLIVAGEVYQLLAPLLAVGAAMLVGALASTLAIRWAGQVLAALGLVGALTSPVLVGAPSTAATIAMLAVATVSAAWVVAWQRWRWLAIAVPLISAPQWAGWILSGHSWWGVLAVLVGFTAIGLAGALATQARAQKTGLEWAAAAMLVLNGCISASVGYVALSNAAGAAAGEVWLAVLAAVHIAPGLCCRGRFELARPARRLLIVPGVVLADVAFALSVHGLALAVGWGAAAVVFAWLARTADRDASDETLLALGIGAHIGLALLRTLLASDLGAGSEQLVQLLTGSILAASCLACAALAGPPRRALHTALNSLGLVAVAYVTATALDGVPLVLAWLSEAVALARLRRRTGERVAELGSFAFLAGATILTMAVEAPPASLVVGAPSLVTASIALAAVSLAVALIAGSYPSGSAQRRWLALCSGISALYFVSVALVTVFQPTGTTGLGTVLELSVRQQGQVLLSTMWSLIGLAGLIAGLRRQSSDIRTAGLALLLLSVIKVFGYDLSTLTSIYRVASFIALGLLLLAGAFAYQRLRPPPLPDMRTVHRSQR